MEHAQDKPPLTLHTVKTQLHHSNKMLASCSTVFNPETFFPCSKPKFQSRSRMNFNTLSIQSSVKLQDTEKDTPKPKQTSPPFPPIKSSKRIVLVRHGQSTWNAEGRIQGSSNFSVLTEKGEAQAETSRQMLENDAFDLCFASPLARSKRTAEVIWNTREKEIITDYELREIDLYSFQGLVKQEGKAKFGEEYVKWQKDAPNFCIDGHYPVRELWDRARNCWSKILDREEKSILVVAHNAVNQALVSTAIGLGTEYFRILVQSNCGVTVLDFTPQEGGVPHVCLNRLNQTPYTPIKATIADGRKSSKRIVFACHGSTLSTIELQKTAELLLDLKASTIISSTQTASVETATNIGKLQEAADCTVEIKKLPDLEVEFIMQKSKQGASVISQFLPGWNNDLEDGVISEIWEQAGKVWKTLLDELSDESEAEKNLIVVGHPAAHMALIGHCLNLTKEWMGSFHLDDGGISVIDFPDGPAGRGVILCTNYTAHLGRLAIPVTRAMEDKE